MVTLHPAYEALGETAAARRDAYRHMFAAVMAEDELTAIRDATRFEWALATEAFRLQVEVQTGQRTARLPFGPRPRGASDQWRL